MSVQGVKDRKAVAKQTKQGMYRNTRGQHIWFIRNPSYWQTNYSVWGNAGTAYGTMLVSHHSTQALAEAAAKRLRNKDILKILGWKK